MAALFSLLVVLILSLLVTRIASAMLAHTGLSKEVARFQARSAFTGVGFTTSESESLVRHPVRRRILMMLMLLGNAGVITVISSLVLTFINVQSTSSWVLRGAILVGGVLLLWLLARSQWVDRHLSLIIDRALRRWTDIDVRDYVGLLHLAGDHHLVELEVEAEDWLANATLQELQLRDEGVQVLGITREDGRYLGAPRGDTAVLPGDTLILYGRGNVLENLDRRRRDYEGERQHREAVAEQARALEEQKAKDEAGVQTVEPQPAVPTPPHVRSEGKP